MESLDGSPVHMFNDGRAVDGEGAPPGAGTGLVDGMADGEQLARPCKAILNAHSRQPPLLRPCRATLMSCYRLPIVVMALVLDAH